MTSLRSDIEELKRLMSKDLTISESGDYFILALATIPRLIAQVERMDAALRDLLQYIDDHDWGTIPEGATADRAREALKGMEE